MRTVAWTAQSSACKRGPLNFSTKDLVLKRAKTISIVYLPLTCAIVASLLRCSWLTLDFDSFVDCCASSDLESDENLEGSSSSSSIKDDLCPCSRQSLIRVAQWKIRLDITCLCGVKQTAKHKAYKLYTWFKFSVTAHWRNIAKYIGTMIGLENTTLERFSWRVHSYSDRVV